MRVFLLCVVCMTQAWGGSMFSSPVKYDWEDVPQSPGFSRRAPAGQGSPLSLSEKKIQSILKTRKHIPESDPEQPNPPWDLISDVSAIKDSTGLAGVIKESSTRRNRVDGLLYLVCTVQLMTSDKPTGHELVLIRRKS